MNVEIGLRPRNSFSGNICFQFLVLVLGSVIFMNIIILLLVDEMRARLGSSSI